MNDLFIIGACGLGREIAWLVERINEVKPTWKLRGFIDDCEEKWDTYEGQYPVLGGLEYLSQNQNAYAVCAISEAVSRKATIQKLQNSSVKFATLVDPSVVFSEQVKIGVGTVVCARSVLTIGIDIGSHVMLLVNSTVGRDSQI